MNNILLCILAIGAILFIGACADHEPAPVTTSTTTTTETHEVAPIAPVPATTTTETVHTY